MLLEEGQPSCLSLTWETKRPEPVTVTVSGQVPEIAKNQPITEEKVAKQIKKTGGTPFSLEHLDVQVNGQVFLPVQALNDLRRTGLEELEQAVLAPYRREVPEVQEALEKDETGQKASKQKSAGTNRLPRFRLSFEEPEQLEAALAYPQLSQSADELAVDSTGFAAEIWKETAGKVQEAGLACMLILPHIFRTEARAYFKKNLDKLKSAGFDGVVVRTIEEIQWLKEAKIGLPMIFDDTMYTWNHGAAEAMKAMGASRITMPLELNGRELQNTDFGQVPTELEVYGYLPMMVSAQCIKKTTSGCDKRQETVRLKDRTGKLLSVKNHCRFCYNTIYNPSPLSLLGCAKEIRGLEADGLRMKFTIETKEETADILSLFLKGGMEENSGSAALNEFTRGHFRRGVE